MKMRIFAGFIGQRCYHFAGCSNSNVRASTVLHHVVESRTGHSKDVRVQGEWIGTLEGTSTHRSLRKWNGYLIRQDYHEGAVVKKGSSAV